MKAAGIVSGLLLAACTAVLPAQPCRAGDDVTTAPVVATSDNALQFRVSSALHSDPYLYARHIEVSIKDGDVILSGFVTNDWELSKALRLATDAAQPHKVIDRIELKEGGRR